MAFLLVSTLLACLGYVCALSCQSSPSDYPNITTDWGTYQASSCDPNGLFYVWQNIRYGQAPVGHLRFNKPLFPSPGNQTILQQEPGSSCFQVDTALKDCPGAPPDKDGQRLGGPFLRNPYATLPQSEDCLFLDIYAPISAIESNKKDTPVIVWFYGGAFLYGSKDQALIDPDEPLPLYNGTGLLRAAAEANNGSVIFVAGNYRVGAFGWLGGQSMESFARNKQAVPNAGLYDQRLILKFVQKNIWQVGGNNNSVSAWGESAGGSSVLHHLVANWTAAGEDEPGPLFSKVMVQSPAFEWQWDRGPGSIIETGFQNFSKLAGCHKGNLTCLQNVDSLKLAFINQGLFEEVKCTGTFSVGPAVDGVLLNQLPAITFNESASYAGITSFIASHVLNESLHFVPDYISYSSGFDQLLRYMMPGDKYEPTRDAIDYQYSHIQNQTERAIMMIQDSSFVCNVRQLYQAYPSLPDRYMMSYDFGGQYGMAIHGSDLAPTFWNSNVNVLALLKAKFGWLPDWILELLVKDWGNYATKYQKYLVSHAITGNPNKLWSPSVTWQPAVDGTALSDVMQTYVKDYVLLEFRTISDPLTTSTACDFWANMSRWLTSIAETSARDAADSVFGVLDLDVAAAVDTAADMDSHMDQPSQVSWSVAWWDWLFSFGVFHGAPLWQDEIR